MRHQIPQLASLLLLALLAPAGAQAQVQARAQPTRKETKELLAEIDTAFNARDLPTLLGCFRPTHKTLAAQLEARMKAVMSFAAPLQRGSEIVTFENRDGHAIALVRSTTSCVCEPTFKPACLFGDTLVDPADLLGNTLADPANLFGDTLVDPADFLRKAALNTLL